MNGYPYKTPAEMGVENKYDAFMATKQAVYSVLYNFNVDEHYRGTDERGNNIKKAIKSIVNKARNHTQSPSTALLSFTKDGKFVEDATNANYYSQKYSVSSDIDMKEYTITAIAKLPSGSYISDTEGNRQTKFSANEQFKIMVPKNKANELQNIEGVISVQAKCKNYPVFYAKKDTEHQPYALAYDPYGDNKAQLRVDFKMNTGKIKINKTDSETSEPISGVTFQLTKTDGTVIANATTNSEGIATFSGLLQGSYKLKETATNKDYVITEASFDVNVEYDKTTTKNITNDHKKGDIKVYKVDKDNHKIALGNVKFDLYSEEFKRIIGTYTTDTNGEFSVKNLRTGAYKLIEKNTGKWYNLAENTEIEVEWNEENPIIVENELMKGQVKIVKVDKDNNNILLEGVEFEVLDENNKVLEKIITDENGEALTSRYAIRDFETIKLRETKTLEDYKLSEEIKTVRLKENQITTEVIENEVKKGQVKVVKVDLDNNEIRIPDVEFEIYDEAGNIVDRLVTNEHGEAISKELPISQEYLLKETKTGAFYELTREPQKIVLKENEIVEKIITNEKIKGQIKIIKIDKDDNTILLDGVEFDVLDEQGNVVDSIITDKNGEAISKRLPIDQKYTVIERKTKKEYVLKEKPQIVTLKQNEITETVFENEKIKGYIEITKVDSKTKETLKGAKFEVYNENKQVVGTIETDENGKAISELLPYGKYYLKEIDTGSIYHLLNRNTFQFEIVNNHETVSMTVENEPVDITVDVDKQGTVEIRPGEDVDYVFSNVANNSNIYLDNFKWYDYIPTDYIRLQKMTTGTWNQDLSYSVYYKTNKSDDYILFKENLKTSKDYKLDFTKVKLRKDEYITETMFNFGRVEKGFRETTSPTMKCKSLDTLKNNETFTNHTRTIGIYEGVTADADSKWTTIVHTPKEHEPTLPRTGK